MEFCHDCRDQFQMGLIVEWQLQRIRGQL